MLDFLRDGMTLEKVISIPGSFPMLVLLSIIMPFLNMLPIIISSMILVTFSVPALLLFFIKVASNRDISFRKHTIPLTILSYVAVLVSFSYTGLFPTVPMEFYLISILFLASAVLSGAIYLVYYVIYRIMSMKRLNVQDFRMLFIAVFIPSFIFNLFLIFLVSVYFGDFLYGISSALETVTV